MSSTSNRVIEREEAAPHTLNRFRLLGQIAKGGMAEVFLARTEGLGGFERLLVIKRILPELATDSDFVQMFLDEARIAATLHHANIVQVYDVDIADGQVFYAMEHLHGQTVAAIVRELSARAANIPLGNAIAITAAVAGGLHYAHERRNSDGQALGIVHRDVAPNNVIVTYDGTTKLIDFGIAKAVNNLNHTRFGFFKGKLPYSSPEQSRCEAVDRRSDVFSLGVMLYELTVGERLFTGDNEYELMRVVSEAVVPRPRLRDGSYPPELEAIVLKALAADPAQRYPTARALQNDLEVFASQYRLDLSTLSLARLLESLFRDEVVRWRDAERAGMTLAQHITGTLTTDDYLPEDADASLRDPSTGDLVAPPRVADPPARAVTPVRPARWRDSSIVRYFVRSVALGLVIGGLISAGALGALWWFEPLPVPQHTVTPARLPVPETKQVANRAGSAPDPAAGVARNASSPAEPATAYQEPPSSAADSAPIAADRGADPRSAAAAPARRGDAPASDHLPPAASPDETSDREAAAPPPRRPKRSRSRLPHARGAVPGELQPSTRPSEPARPLDDATLDEVAPRSIRSR